MIKKFFKWIGFLVLILLALVASLLLYLSLTEFTPDKITSLYENEQNNKAVSTNEDLKIVSFNIGYGGLGKDSDFFMDGGKNVYPESKELVESNLNGIANILGDINPDFTFLQEVDINSKRSFSVDEKKYFESAFSDQNKFFAENYKVKFVPFPFPPLGKVDSGLFTSTDYSVTKAERISLTVPFKWPTRIANLKRCLLVTRIPVKNTDKEFVLANVHLEAYEKNGGREVQTKELIKFMEEEYKKGNYVLAGGDFNQSFFDMDELPFVLTENMWKPEILDKTLFPKDFKIIKDDSLVPSCRSLDKPYKKGDKSCYIIDGFVASPNIKVKHLETYKQDFEFSDHNPIVLDFSLE